LLDERNQILIKMVKETTTAVRVNVPNELNFKLDIHLAQLKRIGVKKTKADLIVTLTAIGLHRETGGN